MRVTETKPQGSASMGGKKKHKIRKQSKSVEVMGSDSSDDGTSVRPCSHVSKAVNLNAVRKYLKQATLGDCTDCQKGATGGHSRAAEGAAGEDTGLELETTICLCLQCGHQGCDRNSRDRHALMHYQTPHSSLHSLIVNLTSWQIWCYDCDDDVSPTSSSKLMDCVEYIRKQAGLSRPEGAEAVAAGGARHGRTESAVMGGEVSVESTGGEKSKGKTITREMVAAAFPGGYLPKVKGLSNLGNTCFFNAVMQNLSQTPVLDHVISEHCKKGASISLPGQSGDAGDLSSSSSSSEEEHEDRQHLDPLTITVNESGPLTSSLSNFLRDMKAVDKSNVVTPSSLFTQVCKKAPRFKGFQQQDSHELLRHLLDGMKAEEIKRCQSGILKSFNVTDARSQSKLDEKEKDKIKEYGRQAKHTFIDKIFGGQFISTVLCEECQTPSVIIEPFLDVSVPIMEEKPQRPNSMWAQKRKEGKKDKKETAGEEEEDAYPKYKAAPSKYMSKKARRQAKKMSKKLEKSRKGKKDSAAATNEQEGSGDEQQSAEVSSEEAKDDQQEKGAAGGNRSGGEKGSGEEKGSEEEKDCGDEKGSGEDKGSAEEREEKRSHSNGDDVSDADVEDNVELDAARNPYHCLQQSDDAEQTGRQTATEIKPCSLNSSQHVPNENTTNSDADTDKVKSSQTETQSASQKDNSGTENSEKTEGHIQNSKDKTRNSYNGAAGSDINVLTQGMSDLSLNTEQQSKDDTGYGTYKASDSPPVNHSSEHIDRRDSACANDSARSKNDTTHQKRKKVKFLQEVAIKALNTLASRYHSSAHECSVLSCLHQFTAAELLTGPNRFGCEHCTKARRLSQGKEETVYCNASKQLLIFAPPAVLTLHLKRFQQSGFSLRKVSRHVEFPLVLDLAPYCSALCQGVRPGQKRVLYSLYGIVEHSGHLSGGHYTAYVKVRPNGSTEHIQAFLQQMEINSSKLYHLLEKVYKEQRDDITHRTDSADGEEGSVAPPSGKWFYISDTRVTDANEQNVLRCQAYLLFYERIY